MALLINYLSKEKIFVHYLITTRGILEDEYPIPNSTRRINLNYPKRSVFDAIEENHIDILNKNYNIISQNQNRIFKYHTKK